jgi:hypothetical protein
MMSARTSAVQDRKRRQHSSRQVASRSDGDLIDNALAVWQPRSKRQLTREDGREIIENMTGFFRILQEWDQADRAKRSKKH